MIRIAINTSRRCSRWWDAARAAIDTCPIALRALVGRTNATAALVSEDDAADFRVWGEQFDGWYDGPVYSPTPFTWSSDHDSKEAP